jgi:hypothetical protein
MKMDIAKIGTFDLDKGNVRANVKMFAWDGIRECDPHECPMVDECAYPHKGKCAVQVQYMQALYTAILNTYSFLDEAMLFKIGIELIPLYVQLSRLQIIELSLASPVYQTKVGPSIHPVYREIRDTLRAIQSMWKGLEMSFTFGEKLNLHHKGDGKKKVDLENGDPDFYKKISQEGASRKGVIR